MADNKEKKEEKKSSYISAKESRRITKFNRKVTKKLEADRANAKKDPSLYMTHMKDDKNVVEFDNVCTYFFSDVGVVKAVDGISFNIPKCSTVGVVGESGCGKSVTSLSLMQLLQRPSGQTVGGEIRFNLGDGTAYNIVNTPTSKMQEIREAGYSGLIEADGGLNEDNLQDLADSGLDVAVMGTALFRAADMEEAIKRIHRIKTKISRSES